MNKLKIDILSFQKKEANSYDHFIKNNSFLIKKHYMNSKILEDHNQEIINILQNLKSDYFFFHTQRNKINLDFFNKLDILEKKNLILTKSFYNLKNKNKFPSHSIMMQKKTNFLENDIDYIFSCIFNTKSFIQFIKKFNNLEFDNVFCQSYLIYLFFMMSVKEKDYKICNTFFQQINENFSFLYSLPQEQILNNKNITEIHKISGFLNHNDKKSFFLSYLTKINSNKNVFHIIKHREKTVNSNLLKIIFKLINNIMFIYDSVYSSYFKLYQKKFF